MSLPWAWFFLVGLLLAIYAATDGYDLGIGVLYPFITRNEGERRQLRQSIGPVWDGNEVWLLVAGGALFGAFPLAYANAMSAFYLAIMLVLFGLILRAVSLEYRSHGTEVWRFVFDAAFFFGSLIPALLFGVAVGNLIEGIAMGPARGPLGSSRPQVTSSSLLALITPYSLLVGLTGLAIFLMVGASWAALKTQGDLQRRTARARSAMQAAFVALFVLVTVATAANGTAKEQLSNALSGAAGWVMLAVLIGGLAYARWGMLRRDDWGAFVGAVVAIAGLIGVAAAGMYPALIRAESAGHDVTVSNAASGHLTQTLMLVVALIAVPLVIAYSVYVNRVFAGRVAAEDVEY
jgi:cytochrome d ubiquinol oxidase subunit II